MLFFLFYMNDSSIVSLTIRTRTPNKRLNVMCLRFNANFFSLPCEQSSKEKLKKKKHIKKTQTYIMVFLVILTQIHFLRYISAHLTGISA